LLERRDDFAPDIGQSIAMEPNGAIVSSRIQFASERKTDFNSGFGSTRDISRFEKACSKSWAIRMAHCHSFVHSNTVDHSMIAIRRDI